MRIPPRESPPGRRPDPGARDRARRWYAENREKALSGMRKRHAADPSVKRAQARRQYEAVRDFLNEERRRVGCVDCGTREGTLAFDHRPGTVKQIDPSRARSIRAARVEIAKCDVRCASCHARRHEEVKRRARKS